MVEKNPFLVLFVSGPFVEVIFVVGHSDGEIFHCGMTYCICSYYQGHMELTI